MLSCRSISAIVDFVLSINPLEHSPNGVSSEPDENMAYFVFEA